MYPLQQLPDIVLENKFSDNISHCQQSAIDCFCSVCSRLLTPFEYGAI